MKAIVEEYARGEFEVKRPEVEISVARLALEVETGTLYRGSFTIKSANDMNIKNSTPHTLPPGIWLNTFGSVINKSDGPLSGLIP